MFMWFFYNWLIFGDALEFQRGKYSAAAAQAGFARAGLLPTQHHLLLSVVTYGWSVLDNLGGVVFVLGAAGLVTYMVTTRLRLDSLIPYAFLSAFVFNVISLWGGQTVILTPQTHPTGYFNVRYGIMLLPAAAFFIAYLADFLASRLGSSMVAGVMALIVLGQSLLWIPGWPNSVPTVTDGLYGLSAHLVRGNVPGIKAAAPAAQYMREHYRGGGILMYDSDYPWFVEQAGVHVREYIDVYNGKLWNLALQDPTPYVQWVVLHPGEADPTMIALSNNANFISHYTRQYATYDYALYRRTRP